MKKVVFAVGFLMALFGASAMAEDAKANEPFKYTLLSYKESGDAFKVNVADLKGGVFVKIGGGSLFNATFPKCDEFVRGLLRAKGIKVAEKIEDADYGFQVADVSQDYLNSIEEDAGLDTHAEVVGKEVLKGIAVFLVTGGISAMKVGQAINTDLPIVDGAEVSLVKKPSMTMLHMLSGDDKKVSEVEIKTSINRLAKKGDSFNARTLASMVSGYLDAHFVGMTAEPVAIGAASSVPQVSASAEK